MQNKVNKTDKKEKNGKVKRKKQTDKNSYGCKEKRYWDREFSGNDWPESFEGVESIFVYINNIIYKVNGRSKNAEDNNSPENCHKTFGQEESAGEN